ncbi:MAG: hypothetical protein OEX18_04080 [Candidatus Krumholzibacteria bacterium]|nr:hypothetical protein [Candidatus Krumholzibacteria bacterium]MDH4336438.1 hypothetical protein [Candidatus Krumholzibacteria bacterium]MDH5269563.1 hypothetical protein [Candidatus Krumholzibacteria bacterium]
MENSRFLAILNRAARKSGLDLSGPASASDPAVVAAWAVFLRECVDRGVSIADPRWRSLEIRSPAGTPTLALNRDSAEPEGEDETDFTLGLSLLVSMLGRNPDKEDR